MTGVGREAVPVMPRGVRLHFDQARDAWVLLAPERAIRLDAIGHAILSEVDGTRSLADILATLAARFEAQPDQVGQDCGEFVATLVERRVLDRAP
jgi:pyrroloquinoline quinone biosynthesis protein D